jgi:arginase
MTGRRALGVLGAPSSAGAYAPGQERAPGALREAGLLAQLEAAGLRIHDHGNAAGFRWRPDRERPFAQNLRAVIEIASEAAKGVWSIVDSGELALVLGGDCTIELGVVAGSVAASSDRIGLLYFDLHADLNTPRSVVDGALDWMGVAHLLAEPETEPELVHVAGSAPLLEPDQILLYAFRPASGTQHERDAIARLGLDVEEFEAVAAAPRGSAERALSRLLQRCDRVLVHFDVDVVDFTDAPLSENTGRNIGLPLAAAFEALEVFAASDRLAAITITELNPDHGEADGATLRRFVDGLAAALGG